MIRRVATRREFLTKAAGASALAALPVWAQASGWDFYFTRLRYESGNWDVDERMPNNLLNSLIEYSSLRVDPEERVIDLSDRQVLESPFCYLSGHKLVEFSEAEAKNFVDYVERGGFVFVDDCNHDIDALFATSFTRQMERLFGAECLAKLPDDHPVYSSFFDFDGPPTTSFELNGWGDDLVHDYLRGIEIDGRTAVLYSNKDYGCEWDYDYRNKRWLAVDNTRFGVNIVMYALNY